MWQIPEGESEDDERFRLGRWHGYRERKPTSEDSVYIAGWCHGYDRRNGCGLGRTERVFIAYLYGGGL